MPTFASLLAHPKPLIGVLHLPPLPGAPRSGPGLQAILEGAVRDARVLALGGAQAVIIENLGDAPFSELVEPHVTAMLAVVAQHVLAAVGHDLVVGVNALRNDGLAALGAAAGSGSSFVRINVLTGAMVTDQGVIQGRARETLLYRNRVAPNVGIVADVMVKHASPLGMGTDLAQSAKDCFGRGGADVLVVSGSGTGAATSPADLDAVRRAVPSAPVWIGSGFGLATAELLAPRCTGAIVGTALHQDGDLDAPLDLGRVQAVRAALG